MKGWLDAYQDGGEMKSIDNSPIKGVKLNGDPQANFVENWLNNRKAQLLDNFKSTKEYNSIHTKYHNILGKERELGNELFYEQKNNIDNTFQLSPKEYLDMNKKYGYEDSPNTLGQFNKQNNTFFVKDKFDNTSIEVHERSHSGRPTPQMSKIKTLLDNDLLPSIKDVLKRTNNKKAIKYATDPDEINSNLMQLRYDNKLEPNHKVTPNEVDKLNKNNNLLFKLFDNDDITKLLNEIAQNKQPDNLPIAKNGGKMQEHQPNFNNSSVSIPQGFVGQGETIKNWKSPAWEGQFKEGGQLIKLDQLTNFTNYNTKQPGGWLNQYNK